MKIIFMGTPNFAAYILEELKKKYDVVLTVSQPNRNNLTPVYKKSCELNIMCLTPNLIKDCYEEIRSYNADILVTAAYGQFVPTNILKLFKKCINVHGSLLPKYRGGAPIQRAIINGDKETGISLIEMERGMDSGDIYVKSKIDINDSDTNSILFDKLSYLGAELLVENIEDIYNGKIIGYKQDKNDVTYAYNLTKSDELIDFNKTSFEVQRKINGLSHEPGAYFSVNDKIIKVYSAKINNDYYIGSPGEIVDLNKKIVIKTKDSAIELEVIKLSGKKELNSKEFLNGQNVLKLGIII